MVEMHNMCNCSYVCTYVCACECMLNAVGKVFSKCFYNDIISRT